MSGITGVLVILLTIGLVLLGVAPLLTLLPVAAFAAVVLSFYTYYFLRAPAQLDKARQAAIDALSERYGRELKTLNAQHETGVATFKNEIGELQTKLDALSATQPNFAFLCFRLVFAHIDDRHVMRSGGVVGRTITAIVAEFENKAEPPRRVAPTETVIAHITYYEIDGRYHGRINKGMWLGEEYNNVAFAVGDTRRLVIATTMENSNSFYNYQNDNDGANRRDGLTVLPLDKAQFNVHVELISREYTEAKKDFRFKLALDATISQPFSIELIEP